MKKGLAALLCVMMVFGLFSGALPAFAEQSAAEQPAAEIPADFEARTEAQAFAVAMACWNSYYEASDTVWPMFGWEASGWYAAWLYRVDQVDLISDELAADFQLSVGMAEPLSAPEDWLGYQAPQTYRNADGSFSYDFQQFKEEIDELLGIEVEVLMTAEPGLTERVVVTQHFGYGDHQASRTFILRFEENPNPDSSFAYRLAGVSIPDTEPELDPQLGFTWADLTKANSLENILSLYPSVRCYSKEYSYGGETWLFLHSGDPVLLTGGEGYYSGRFRGCDFEYEETEDGTMRARIGSIDSELTSMGGMDSFILDVFNDPTALLLDRIEDGLIWTEAVYSGGYRQKLAFDRDTLVLREAVSLADDGTELGTSVYEYNTPKPDLEFLKSWDAPLRKINVIWETYSDSGEQILRTETVEVPMDWEYLPYEARWGEFTPYTNEEYIGPYVYPGDGAEYLLFLTTVKG